MVNFFVNIELLLSNVFVEKFVFKYMKVKSKEKLEVLKFTMSFLKKPDRFSGPIFCSSPNAYIFFC